MKGVRTLEKRKSVISSFKALNRDILKQRLLTPHAEMELVTEALEQNTFFISAANTSTDFIMGDKFEFESEDDFSKKMVEEYWDSLEGDLAFREAVMKTISVGNGLIEKDFYDLKKTNGLLVPSKAYVISDPSQYFINSDEYGNPLKRTVITQFGQRKEVDNNEEYWIQKVSPAYNMKHTKMYNLSYYGNIGLTGNRFQIYGIPIDKRKITHFKLTVGLSGLYGRSQFASAINDHEMLHEIEKSITTIAKYKSVPRKFYQYGDKEMPATDDELDDLTAYLESLDMEDDALVNKPITSVDMSYSGGEINLDYAIQHVKKKMVAGVTLDFLSGMGQDVNRSTAQTELLAFILAIYSKRKIFLRIIQKEYIDPFIKWKKLEKVSVKFPTLDFETKGEKEARIRANWATNMITLNEMREEMGLPKLKPDRDKEVEGNMLMGELQSKMLPDMGGGFGFGEEFDQDNDSNFGDFGNGSVNSSTPKIEGDVVSEALKNNPTGTQYLQNQMAVAIREVFRKRLKLIQQQLQVSKTTIERHIVSEATLGIEGLDIITMGLEGISLELKPTVMKVLTAAWMKANMDIVKNTNFVGLQIPFDRRILNAMTKNSLGFIEKYATGQSANLRLTLTNGITQGDSISSIAREIRDNFKLTAAKSEQIARTEIIKTYNEGAYTAMINSGVKRYKWITAGDERVRHSHSLLNGRVFEFGKKGTMSFKSGGKMYQIPKSPKPGQLGSPELDINCFINHNVPIFTSKGWKHIGKIKKGDKVLSHTGKFRKVKKVLSGVNYIGEVIKIGVSWKFYTSSSKHNEREEFITVTPEHPILTSNGWKTASELNKYDRVIVTAKKCVECGDLHPSIYYRKDNKFCSSICSSRHTANIQFKDKEQHKIRSVKASKQMYKEYANGTRDRFKITKGANKKVRELVSKGDFILQTMDRKIHGLHAPQYKEIKKEVGKKIGISNSIEGRKRIGKDVLEHEKKFKEILDKININYEWHKYFKYEEGFEHDYRVDFFLPEHNLVIEIDKDSKLSKYDRKREEYIKSKGYKLLRILNNQVNILSELEITSSTDVFSLIKEAQNLVMNHLGLYEFMELEISSIKKWTLKNAKKLYNFAVDVDESFIAKGFATHNCRCGTVPMSEVPGVEYPDIKALKKSLGRQSYTKESLTKLKEAIMTIDIPDMEMQHPNVKKVSFNTLMEEFGLMFVEPRITEIFYKDIKDGWKLSFVKNGLVIYANVFVSDVIEFYAKGEEVSKEDKQGYISAWENQYLKKSIKEE